MKRTYPDKLIILWPMHDAKEYRRTLSGVDDALVVHRRRDGEFVFELRPMAKLGPRSYGKYLVGMAADLEAGYTLLVVSRDAFLDELQDLALRHAGPKEREDVERAAQVVAERTRNQILDHEADASDDQHRFNAAIIASRARDTKFRPGQSNNLNCRFGIPTPRSEQLWHSFRDDLCDVRSSQRGYTAWERWTARNRPDMPKVFVA